MRILLSPDTPRDGMPALRPALVKLQLLVAFPMVLTGFRTELGAKITIVVILFGVQLA